MGGLAMSGFRLSRDIEMTFRRLHTVRAKAGTPVLALLGGSPRGFVIAPTNVETDSPRGRGTLWDHDTTYHYIWVPFDAVEAANG